MEIVYLPSIIVRLAIYFVAFLIYVPVVKFQMKRKLLTKKGKYIDKKRGSSIEPVYGQIKDNR